ncbi:pectinesterase inhibitor 3 [Cynara cardunculus var. scolymus]|uniref:Pectinesterase inhibitor n=1 Tax=Cynara cardunculus var. scolymus TaxID=59895 RepID=A0A103YNE6_CYNCS|nr:pectinesterase inhibitor 3 [Cynara cardunculus var. scolymus]KVI12232.1 Pectinesterase inhibitor [Cynara cardunculus var. scolymus]
MAIFFFFFFSILALFASPTVLASPSSPDLVSSSCQHATFPKVCLHTLSLYGGKVTTPRELAQAAIKVSISRASKASDYLSSLQKEANKRERGAVKDCAGQMSESVEELRKTLGELKELRRGTFRWQMSNAETWVSAALTNEDTCLDGFKEIDGRVRSDVKRKVTNVAKVTSNALYLINRLDHP